jgi:hypothetical protein
MAVVKVNFPRTNARDIHLLPGLTSPRLDQLLHIQTETPDPDPDHPPHTENPRADHPPAGVTTQFQALFIDAPEAHGVKFDEHTGEIEVTSPLPAPRLRSFIVLCGCNEGSNVFTLPIRVHVHEAIDDWWLTPAVLHVREGAENMRFSVLARFDDGVIGDITNWSALRKPTEPDDRRFVHRTGEAVPALHWSSPHVGHITVDPDTGELTAESPDAQETITVERRPLPAPPDLRRRGLVLGGPKWDTPVTVIPVQGKGFTDMMSTRNILFLPDGFLNNPTERDQFSQLVRGIVRRLTYHPQTSPFDLLSQQQTFNYFMAWVPSPDPGVSVLNEQDRINVVGTQGQGLPMELPVPARSGVAAWNLEELLYEVGSPTPVNDPPGSPLGTEAAGRLHDWRELYGEDITGNLVTGPHTEPDGTVTTVYQAWLNRDDRVLLNERDTAFHLAMSDRPRLDGFATERDLGFNRLRLTEADFDRFLGALIDDQGHNIGGGTWAAGGPDQDLVVLLCRSLRNAGANGGRSPGGKLLALSLGGDPAHDLQDNAVGEGFDLVEDPIPADVSIDTWVTVAHELAHSWLLKDEYGGKGLISDDRADVLKDFANAQPRKTLETGGSLDGDKIKWRWPRIAKAGVLDFPPSDEGGGGAGPFRVKLHKHHGYEFARGDIVRLRTRPLPTAVTSDRLRIDKMLGDGDEVQLVLLPGSALDVAAFPAGSLLICPRRAPDKPDGFPGDDLELVDPSVRARINDTHNPLNAAAAADHDRPCSGAKLPTPTGATNFPGGAAPKPPRFSSWIVGLYENGFAFDCGVYRPTGVCLMREETFFDVADGRDRAYEFCPVCRYAIVDVVDPFWHRDVDVGMRDRFLA